MVISVNTLVFGLHNGVDRRLHVNSNSHNQNWAGDRVGDRVGGGIGLFIKDDIVFNVGLLPITFNDDDIFECIFIYTVIVSK